MKKIFITGGHLTPALAVADELVRREWKIYYLGRTTAYSGERTASIEYKEIKSRGWNFLRLPAGKIPRFLTWDLLPNLFLIPLSFLVSLYYLLKYKPQAVVSFGSYLAVAPILTASLLKIPTITHEQTMSPGLANRIIARFCDKICISWQINETQYPKTKTVLTGNPLRREIFVVDQKYEISGDKPLLYITGGNLGSHSLNQAIAPIISELLNTFNIIHQCGNSKIFNDLESLNDIKANLDPEKQKCYVITSFVDVKHIGWVFKNADLMLGRAGANTVSEVIKFQIPALFIPLPWAGAGEQLMQAKFLADKEAGMMIEQKNLTPEILKARLVDLIQDRDPIRRRLVKLKYLIPDDAAVRIADIVYRFTQV